MENKKMTKREKFAVLLSLEEVQANEMLVEFINHELALLEKKNGKSANGEKSLTPNQKINENVKVEILGNLRSANQPVQIKDLDLVKSGKYSNQKISALLKQLVADGLVERLEDKKVTMFALPKVEEIVEEDVEE